jgi:hypothetical protein
MLSVSIFEMDRLNVSANIALQAKSAVALKKCVTSNGTGIPTATEPLLFSGMIKPF